MVRREGAAGLADDVRHRQLGLTARLRDGVDHIVRILLRRVVDAGVVRGTGPVVVNPQAATDVHVRDVDAHVPEFAIVARHLGQSGLDKADVGDLTPEMEVNQFENIDALLRVQTVNQLDQFRGAHTELALLTATLRPSAGALTGEFDAHTAHRLHVEFLGDFQQDIQFTELFEDDEHAMAELLSHEGQSHEFMIFVAVADDQVLGAVG